MEVLNVVYKDYLVHAIKGERVLSHNHLWYHTEILLYLNTTWTFRNRPQIIGQYWFSDEEMLSAMTIAEKVQKLVLDEMAEFMWECG